jgi:hypothetical protein
MNKLKELEIEIQKLSKEIKLAKELNYGDVTIIINRLDFFEKKLIPEIEKEIKKEVEPLKKK